MLSKLTVSTAKKGAYSSSVPLLTIKAIVEALHEVLNLQLLCILLLELTTRTPHEGTLFLQASRIIVVKYILVRKLVGTMRKSIVVHIKVPR